MSEYWRVGWVYGESLKGPGGGWCTHDGISGIFQSVHVLRSREVSLSPLPAIKLSFCKC